MFRLNSVSASTNSKHQHVGSLNEMNAKSNKIMKFCLRHFIVTNSAAAHSSFSASDFKCWLEFKYLNKRKVCNISNISKSVLKQHYKVHVTDIRKLLNNFKKLILLVLSFSTLWVAYLSLFLNGSFICINHYYSSSWQFFF